MQNIDCYKIQQRNIDSIRRVNFINDANVNIRLQLLCKDVLTMSMNRADGFKYDEVGILVSILGKYKSNPMWGYNGIIDISNPEYQEAIITNEKNSLAFIHNHPDNSIISYGDLINLITTDSIKIVIAVANNGNISYAHRMYADDGFYIKLYRNIQNKIHSKAKSEVARCRNEIYKKILNNPEKYGLSIKKSRRKK